MTTHKQFATIPFSTVQPGKVIMHSCWRGRKLPALSRACLKENIPHTRLRQGSAHTSAYLGHAQVTLFSHGILNSSTCTLLNMWDKNKSLQDEPWLPKPPQTGMEWIEAKRRRYFPGGLGGATYLLQMLYVSSYSSTLGLFLIVLLKYCYIPKLWDCLIEKGGKWQSFLEESSR